VDCDHHPLFDTAVGTTRTYSMNLDGNAGELTMALTELARDGEARVATWEFSFGLTGGPAVPSRVERRCDERGAEEPWFGYGMDTMLRLENQTWRWPDVLSPDLAFGGEVDGVVGTLRLTATREHRVVRREHVQVPAGSFDAWRVETNDAPAAGGEPHRSTWWVVEGVGLVRSVQQVDADTTLTQELTRYGSGDQAGI
jgi:hypothetical protein